MKRLTLYRHAKTERDSASGRDFDRRLTERGRENAARVGREIHGLGLTFDLIVHSPARRAVETAEAAGLPAVRADERIYNATAEQLTAIVEAVDDGIESLLLIGHNPGFERLASRLLGVTIEMPTGSLIEIELPGDEWGNAIQAAGRLIRFLKPKELN